MATGQGGVNLDIHGTAQLYSLTNPQMGIWNTEKLYPGTSISVIAATLKIKGPIDYPVLEKAVNLFIERNDGLRLCFVVENGEPKQYLKPYCWHPIDFKDFDGQDTAALYRWDSELTGIPMSMSDTELFYFSLFRISDTEGGFFVKIHHLLSDAWSFILLGNQIMSYYHALLRNQPVRPEKVTSYLDYVASEQQYYGSDRFLKDKAYWDGRFELLPDFTTLKAFGSGSIGNKARRKTFVLPRKLCLKIQEHCTQYQTSPFSLFLASLAIYINRVTGKDDLVIGTPVLNRTNYKEKETIGMFISTVPIRIGMRDSNMDFKSFYSSISKEWMEILRHQKYPYDLLLKDVREIHKGTEALYDIVLSYQNARFDRHDDDIVEHEGRWHFNGYQKPSLTIHINDREGSGDLVIDYDYRENLYYAKEIEFIHDHIIRILWHALDNPARAVSRIDMISEKEKHRLLHEFNNTGATYPSDATIHGLFEVQAERWPERIAVTCGRQSLTYRELDDRANRLAWSLRRSGAGPDKIVALFMHRSIDMVCAILGVLKSGGAYLPIDPDYPADRVRYLLEDSGAALLVTDQPGTVPFGVTEVDVAASMATPAAGPADIGHLAAPPNANSPHDLAYIIYTSGSTGRPKGVMIEHRNVVRLMVNDRFPFAFDQNDVWSLFHSYCFDFSVWEMYGALLYGGRLVVIPHDATRDTRRFLHLLEKERVTVLSQTPAAFYNLIQEDLRLAVSRLSLRYVVFGGEALKPLLLKPFHDRHPETRLVNMYGITETTVHVTFKEIGSEEIERNVSNIGRAIPTLKTYIMDKNLRLLPIGVPGELCVSGDGVGRGYLGRPDLTAQKFVPNPYMPGETLYRSGDLARLFAQGDLEYLGRIDNQVKIRGHRIELGEIESALLLHPSVQEVALLTRENQMGTRQLCAYYVPAAVISANEIRKHLARSLPDYMIPTYIISVEKMPLTSNGKVDYTKLPMPEDTLEVDVVFAAPETPLQKRVVRVWSEILEIDADRIGIDSEFFTLGGDSLSAIRVVARLDGGLTVSDLYDRPTVRLLAEQVRMLQEAASAVPLPDLLRKPVLSIPKQPADLLRRLSGPRGDATRTLVCFPYGGGTAFNYKALAVSVRSCAPDTVVYAVAPQGHEFGRQEPFQSLEETAVRIAGEILFKLQGPLILYAHCVGIALAAETLRLLEKEHVPIESCFMGGILPPRFSGLFGIPFDPWRHFPDRIVISLLRNIGLPDIEVDPAFTRFVMMVFRRDVKEFYRYFHQWPRLAMPPLSTPIHILVGADDPMTRQFKSRLKSWARYAARYTMTVLPDAGHYFIHSHPELVAPLLLGSGTPTKVPVRKTVRPVVERSASGGS